MNRQNWDLARLKQQETLEWAEKERAANSVREGQESSRPRRRRVRTLLLASASALTLVALAIYLATTALTVSPQAYQVNSGPASGAGLTRPSSQTHMLLLVGKDNGSNSFYHSYPSLGPNLNSTRDRIGTEKY